MGIWSILNILFPSAAAFAWLVFSAYSWAEGERRAAMRSLFIAVFFLLLAGSATQLPDTLKVAFASAWISGSLLLLFLSLLPVGRIHLKPEIPHNRVDERDIPFARVRLKPGSWQFQQYYALRPENLPTDERIRRLPGLLSPHSQLAHPIGFAAADASFDFIETFREAVERTPDSDGPKIAPEKLTLAVKNLARYYGAVTAGICKLRPYHIYTHIGRGTGIYGAPVELDHPYAIAFTVEMSHSMIRTAPRAGAVMESARQYVEAARVAMQLAIFLSKLGFQARAHIDGNYRVIAPLVARDAGLGEIGRMGLLITPELGPRVRIGVVTTDAPLIPDRYEPDASVIDFCRICLKCAENCPCKAIPQGDRREIHGALRWQVDADKCFSYWNAIGTDCGLCMATCPYSHANSFPHRLVRAGIQRSGFLRRAALWLDDLLYGRKPERFPLPKWLNSSASPLSAGPSKGQKRSL